MKLSRQHQWACESTSTNFGDDLAVILDYPKNRIFLNILRKVKHFKICFLFTNLLSKDYWIDKAYNMHYMIALL